jgi:hypothetical protein
MSFLDACNEDVDSGAKPRYDDEASGQGETAPVIGFRDYLVRAVPGVIARSGATKQSGTTEIASLRSQ